MSEKVSLFSPSLYAVTKLGGDTKVNICDYQFHRDWIYRTFRYIQGDVVYPREVSFHGDEYLFTHKNQSEQYGIIIFMINGK